MVIQGHVFGVSGKATRELYYIIMLASWGRPHFLVCRRRSARKDRKSWKSTFLITPLSFDAPCPWNPWEYLQKPSISRLYTVIGLHHCGDSMGLSSFKFSWWAPKDVCVLKQRNRVHNGPSRSSKVVDFGTNRKRVCDSLLVVNSNLGPGPILPRFSDIAGFWEERPTPIPPEF